MRISDWSSDVCSSDLFEIGFALTGEADDEIARDGDVGARRTDALDHLQIGFDAVAAVHRGEDAVATRLHRQVEEGHQLVDLAMREIGRASGRERVCQSV